MSLPTDDIGLTGPFEPFEPFVTIDRSVSIRFAWHRPYAYWGATWALLCGVIAGAAWPTSASVLLRAMAAWFVAVPLLGTIWIPLMATGDSPTGPQGDPQTAPPAGVPVAVARRVSRRGRRAILGRRVTFGADQLLAAVLLVTLASLVGRAVAVMAVLSVVLVVVLHSVRGRPFSPHGAVRSATEMLVPYFIGWFAAAGPHFVPVAVGGESVLSSLLAWWSQNGLVPALAVAAWLMHVGSTSMGGPGNSTGRVGASTVNVTPLPGGGSSSEGGTGPTRTLVLLAAGYGLAVFMLAAFGHPLGAGFVALLWVAQWPFQVVLRRGELLWHFRATQWLAMAAMMAAAMAARR